MRLAHLIHQLRALFHAADAQLVQLAKQTQPLFLDRIQRVHLRTGRGGALRNAEAARHRVCKAVHPQKLIQKAVARLRQRPRALRRLRGALDGAEHRLAAGVPGHGRAQLIDAGLAPAVVHNLGQAASAARVQSRLRQQRRLARRKPRIRAHRGRFRPHGSGRGRTRTRRLGHSRRAHRHRRTRTHRLRHGRRTHRHRHGHRAHRLRNRLALRLRCAHGRGFRHLRRGLLGSRLRHARFFLFLFGNSRLIRGRFHSLGNRFRLRRSLVVRNDDLRLLALGQRNDINARLRCRLAEALGLRVKRKAILALGLARLGVPRRGDLAIQHHGYPARAGTARQNRAHDALRGLLRPNDLHQPLGAALGHNVGIHDVSVELGTVWIVVFVGTDFVVFRGMLTQIQRTVAPKRAHARLKPAGLVFVRHNANAALVGEFPASILNALKHAVSTYKQRLNTKIGFLRQVFLQIPDGYFSRESH